MNTTISGLAVGALICSIMLSSCDSGPEAGSNLTVAPKLTAPLDGSADGPNALYLEWAELPDAVSYHVQVSTRSDFAEVTFDRPNIVSAITPVNELILGSSYFWRVRAHNDMGMSDWSEIWSFTAVRVANRPSAPVLAYPPDGAVDQGTTVTFGWSATDGARFYHIQASLEQDFFRREADMIIESDTSQSVSALIVDYTYFWRVRAQNAVGYGLWSPTRFVVIAE